MKQIPHAKTQRRQGRKVNLLNRSGAGSHGFHPLCFGLLRLRVRPFSL